MDNNELAKLFHETYERLAPSFGYKTRKESAVSWEQVPEKNKSLMRAVCGEILSRSQEEIEEHCKLWQREGDCTSCGVQVECVRALEEMNKRYFARAKRTEAEADCLRGVLANIKNGIERSQAASRNDLLTAWLAAFKRDYLDADPLQVVRVPVCVAKAPNGVKVPTVCGDELYRALEVLDPDDGDELLLVTLSKENIGEETRDDEKSM